MPTLENLVKLPGWYPQIGQSGRIIRAGWRTLERNQAYLAIYIKLEYVAIVVKCRVSIGCPLDIRGMNRLNECFMGQSEVRALGFSSYTALR
jgi:hypothetical protein